MSGGYNVDAVPRERLAAMLAVGALALGGCGSSSSDAPPTTTVRVGDAEVRAEIADDETERRRGLAGRDDLSEDRGMLFVYRDRAVRTYWMKGVRFPLDIIWIDRGRVTGVEADVPVPRGQLPVYSSRTPADRVLEVPGGWAARHGVGRGDRVAIESGLSY
jgi:uncharacterized membrane protein (UPF0127 family)